LTQGENKCILSPVKYHTFTHGTDDPTRATLPFLGALEAGHKAQILLQGEATYLMRDILADQIHGVGCPHLNEILAKVYAQKIPIFV
jgi:predicted peroxiredoxin